MTKPRPPLDPPVADQAPRTDELTGYDYEHLVTYLRLLDAEADGADWRASCFTSIRRVNMIAPGAPGRVIWPVPNG
jgi:hypothetical protein